MAATKEKVRGALERKRDLLLRGLDRESEGPGGVSDLADVATARLEQLADEQERQRRQERISQIDAALGRLDDGTWGDCQQCGGRIAAGRLAALPTATTCVSCASG